MTFILFLDMENSIKEQEGANRGNYADIRIKKCQVCHQKKLMQICTKTLIKMIHDSVFLKRSDDFFYVCELGKAFQCFL